MTAQGAAAPDSTAGFEQGPQGFLGAMAEKLGMAARHASIYGEPVTNGGITVVTVAKARWGFGGGAGSGTGPGGHKKSARGSALGGQGPGGDEAQSVGEGSGGGGGVTVSPVGYIEITGEGARFHRIWDAQTVAVLTVAAGFAVLLILRGVRKLVR